MDRPHRTDIGTPTIVIPAAATAIAGTPLSLTADQWTSGLSTDLSAPFFVTTEAATDGGRRPAGRIVMIGNWAGHVPHEHVQGYSVAKAGLRMLTKLLGFNLAPHRILVNEVAIGVVDAGVSRKTFESQADQPDAAGSRLPAIVVNYVKLRGTADGLWSGACTETTPGIMLTTRSATSIMRRGISAPCVNTRQVHYWAEQAEHFLDCVEGKSEPMTSVIDSARVVAALAADVESSQHPPYGHSNNF